MLQEVIYIKIYIQLLYCNVQFQCIKELDAIDVQYECAVSKYSEINIGERERLILKEN